MFDIDDWLEAAYEDRNGYPDEGGLEIEEDLDDE